MITLRKIICSLLVGAGLLLFSGQAQAAGCPTPQLAVVVCSGGILQLPAATAQVSARFGPDNGLFTTGTVNNALTVATGANYVPTSDVLKSWFIWTAFRVDDSLAYTGTTALQTILGSCAANSSCTGGFDRHLAIQSMAATQPGEINWLSGNASVAWWQGAAHTGLEVVPGATYCIAAIQYGDDSATPGYQVLAVNSTSGPAIANSPLVSTTTNQSSAAAGFYYSAAATLRTQSAIADVFKYIGSTITTANTYEAGQGGSGGPEGMVWGVFPNSGGTPTAADLAALCNGTTTLNQYVARNSFTLRSLYPLNDAGTWAADPSGQITGAATATGTVLQGSPTVVPPAITVTELGDGFVMRATPGQTGGGATGPVYIAGTVTNDGGGNANQIDVRLTDGSFNPVTGCDWHQLVAPSHGAYAGIICSPPVGGPYYREARYHNSHQRLYQSRQRVYVGLSVVMIGQSQVNLCFLNASSGQTQTYTSGVLTEIGTTPINTALLTLANNSFGHASLRPLSAASMPGSALNVTGDCGYLLAYWLSQRSGWPVMVVNLGKSAHPIDSFVFGYTTQTQNLAGSGTGPYSGTLTVTPPSPANLVTGFVQAVKASSLSITANGVVIATDDGAGNLTGATVTAGTINYTTRAIAGLTFSGTPAATPVANWTAMEDTQPGAYALNSPLTGFDVWGDGATATSGLYTRLLLRVPLPVSAVGLEQCTANQSEFPTLSGYATGEASYFKKLDLLLARLKANPNWDAATPIVALGYPRDGEAPSTTTWQELTNCRRLYQDIALRGAPYVYGGAATPLTLVSGTGPHADASATGYQRTAYLWANAIWSAQATDNTITRGPEIASAAFAAGPDYSKIDITWSLPNAGATQITTVSGVTTNLDGFRIGTSANQYERDGNDPVAGTLDATKAFSCAVTAATTVRCTRSSGTWTSGNTQIQYLEGSPFYRFQTAASVAVTAGSGYTDGTYTWTNGSGCSVVNPQGTVTVSGGSLVSATITKIGAACTSTSVAIPGGAGAGTGGAITITLGTTAQDTTNMGTNIIDDSGNLNGNMSGLPAKPQIAAVSVSG